MLGVSAGTSIGGACVIVLGIGAGSLWLSLGVFSGAFAAFGLVAILSNGATSGLYHTILTGVAASQLFNTDLLYRHHIGQCLAGARRDVLAARQLRRRASSS